MTNLRRLAEQKAREEEEVLETEVEETEVEETDDVDEVEVEETDDVDETDWKAIAEARQKEIERVKSERRETRKLESFDVPKTEYTKAEVRVFESFRDEAFQEFIEAHPKYRDDETSWNKFLDEYQDRVSEITYAERKKQPVTKRLFKERLLSVHRAIGGTDDAKEQGKREALSSKSKADIYSSASQAGQNVDVGDKPAKKRILPKTSHGFQDWVPKSKK